MHTVIVNGEEITPSKIVCVGRNYVAHIEELGNEVPEEIVEGRSHDEVRPLAHSPIQQAQRVIVLLGDHLFHNCFICNYLDEIKICNISLNAIANKNVLPAVMVEIDKGCAPAVCNPSII